MLAGSMSWHFLHDKMMLSMSLSIPGQYSVRRARCLVCAAQDPEYQHLQELILNGFLDHRSQVRESCRCYWNTQEHLSIDDNLIVHGYCLLIPTTMQRQTFMSHTKDQYQWVMICANIEIITFSDSPRDCK